MSEVPISSTHTDDLSPLARQILSLDIENSYRLLVVRTPGRPEAQKLLSTATPTQMLSSPIRNPDDANAILAGLWLWHDWLDESHLISQSLHSSTGSFWHAIMHRREGDFSNSQYWYARCQNHPVFQQLAHQANQILHPLPADKSLLRLMSNGWNPNAFVDLIASIEPDPRDPKHLAAISLQQLEWRLLFDHCTRSGAGR
ncbi:MAG TPA: hypothetical protein VGQ99_19650 [Tepidisphaeraceae bacterium]|jgi:hypothetical protein|nr:hypothetical protein [Tepidisphaeraceae bacterium]